MSENTQGKVTQVKVAVIGAGGMANNVHYPSLASFSDVQIAAICDIDSQRLETTADKYGVQGRYIFHENFNMDKRAQLLAEHADGIELEEHLWREQWFILRAKRPGISARAQAKQYGMEQLRDYVTRSRQAIDAMRGWAFAKVNLPSATAVHAHLGP